jgi:acyl transferase domain-containing protein
LLSSYNHPDPAKLGKTHARWGGFLKDIESCDAEFFWNFSPRGGANGPQHRSLLEVTFEALEVAGLAPESLAVGISTCDYGGVQMASAERGFIGAYANLGVGMCIAANRISNVLDLHGPSMAIDTACPSSFVAVHLACQSIWRGETGLALTGEV